MKMRWAFHVAIPLLGVALSVGPHVAIGQQAAPTEQEGQVVSIKTMTLELGPEIDGMQGRQLQLRVQTLEPGGRSRVHNHKDRPTMLYVLQGTLTNHERDETTVLRVGDSIAKGKDTTHWVQNNGTDLLMWVAVDIFNGTR